MVKYAIELRYCDIVSRKQALAAYTGMTLSPEFSTNLTPLERVEYDNREEAEKALSGKSCHYEYSRNGGQAVEWVMAVEYDDGGMCLTDYYFPARSNLGAFLRHLHGGGDPDDVINSCGITISECARDWDDVVMYMDPEIAEYLNAKLAPCTNQEFFTAYCQEHEKKYHEPFIWDTENA